MKRLIFALLLLLPTPALADYIFPKPASISVTYVPDYKVNVAVYVITGGIGSYVGAAECDPNNCQWKVFGQAAAMNATNDLQSKINSAGGVDQYIAKVTPDINYDLAQRYPAIGGGSTPLPPATTPDGQINNALSTGYVVNAVSGSAPVLVHR